MMYKNYHMVNIDFYNPQKPIPNDVITSWKQYDESKTLLIFCSHFSNAYMLGLIRYLSLINVAFISDDGKYAQIGGNYPPKSFKTFPNASNNNEAFSWIKGFLAENSNT